MPEENHGRGWEKAVDDALAAHGDRPGGLLPVLHAVQDRLRHIPPEAIARIADAMNISRADVFGVVTYYHDFRTTPPGRHILRICRAEACQAMGGARLAEHVKSRLGIGFKETRADGAVTLEAVYCLGNCALAPAVMLDGRLVGRVTVERFEALAGGEMEGV